MRKNLAQLAERREHLVARAAAQRTVLAESIEPWRAPLAWADRGLAMLSVLKRHPVWIVGGVAAFASLRIDRAGKWLRRGWVTWQVVQKLRGR
ncbi:MAG: YqjK-like family protein [Pseudomonadota bacterium]|nr:YqjK-like family protein [Pseudomonadota bacterium]